MDCVKCCYMYHYEIRYALMNCPRLFILKFTYTLIDTSGL